MLVLSRKKDQTLVIADSVMLRITQIRGNRVTIGIEAPEEVIIRRGEVPPRDGVEQHSTRLRRVRPVCQQIAQPVQS